LPEINEGRTHPGHLAHARCSGVEFVSAEQRAEHAGNQFLFGITQIEVQDAVVGMAPGHTPEMVIDRNERGLMQRPQNLGDPLVADHFAGSKVGQALKFKLPWK
jgi:hypothetical protein